MKRGLLIVSVVLLAGCWISRDGKTYYDYRLLNASDHIFYMQLQERNGDVFPEELTLLPGEDFFWESPPIGIGMGTPMPFWAYNISVTFDDTYTIRRLPNAFLDYEIEDRGKKQRDLVVYTLTNADYEYTVENGWRHEPSGGTAPPYR